jgi:hypothetical protein
MLDSHDERRATERIRLRRRVTITLRGTVAETNTINVSAGGASVELVAAPERGTRGAIVLQLTQGAPLDFVAEVRWTSALSAIGPGGADTRYLVGLMFVDPPADAVARLSEALAAEDDDDAVEED